MKTVPTTLIILLGFFLVACDGGRDSAEQVGWMEVKIFKLAFDWGCNNSDDENIDEKEIERRCDCFTTAMEESLSEDEWKQLVYESQNVKEGEPIPTLGKLQPQFAQCRQPPERQLSSGEGAKA